MYLTHILKLSLARQAAIPPPRKYIEMLSFILQETPNTERWSLRNHYQIDPQTAPNQWKNVLGTMPAPKRDFFGRTPRISRPDLWAPFSFAKSQTSIEQMQSKIFVKNEHPKTPTLMPNGCQQGKQHRCQNTFKNIAKTSIWRYHENYKKSCFSEW